MYVRKVDVHNFMIHRRTALDLFPLTVFVGPNNSGKSSLFDALLNLSRVCSDPIPAAFPSGPYSYRSRHHNGDAADEPVSFEVALSETVGSDSFLQYELAYRQTRWEAGQATYEIARERLVELPSGRVLVDRSTNELFEPALKGFVDSQTSIFAGLRRAYVERRLQRTGLLGHVSANISRFGKYRLDPSLLNRPAPIPDVLGQVGVRVPLPRMRYEGEGLAGVLYFLDRTRDPRLASIVAGVSSAVDGFAGFEFNAVGSDSVGFSARFDDSRGIVEAPNLSAGTLNLIGWLTLLGRGDRQPVLMLEEPELGLTPRSTQAVYDAARAASASAQESTQVLIASHSPRIMHWAANDCGRDHVYVIRPTEGAAETETYDDLLDRGDIGHDVTRALSVEVANQVMHGF